MSFFKNLLALCMTLVIAAPLYAEPARTMNDEAQVVATEDNAININTAKLRDLIKIKGINAARAKAIIGYRKRHGEFKTLDVLGQIKGFTKMKEAQLQGIIDRLVL